MKNLPLFPRPVSWLSAVLLYVFLGLWMTFVAMVLPRLYGMIESSPRLAYLGFLALWLSPIVFVGGGHHFMHAFLDVIDPASPGDARRRRILDHADRGTKKVRGLLPDLGSLWAGVFAWLVIMFASSFCILFLLVLFPPVPDESFMHATQRMLMGFTWPFGDGARAGIHTLAWVVVAAQLYDLERAVKERAKRGEA